MHSESTSSGVMVVDLNALARNYRRLSELARPAECAAVVKANAYGLGMEPVARRLYREGCRRFFVATVSEGETLRGQLPDARIYVLDGVSEGSVATFVSTALTPVLNSAEQIGLWAATGREAVLHVDTGMSRLGLGARDVAALARDGDALAGLRIEYLMTHLACADQRAHPLNCLQLERFERLRRQLPAAATSIANSAGIFLGPGYRGDLVRPGIGLYGGNPFIDRVNELDAVLTLKGRVLQLREVDEAVTVGYGASYGARPPARLAVVGVGYADGYRRSLGNRGAGAVAGVRVPVVGRVSMDYLCLDVSAVPSDELRTGDWVELIGDTVPLDEVAEAAGTIAYEILTGLGARLHREYVGEG